MRCSATREEQMKRRRRWLWNGVAGISLLLCLAAAMLWIRAPGYWKPTDDVTIYLMRGNMLFQWLRGGSAGWYVVTNPNYSSPPAELDHPFFAGYLAIARMTKPLAGYPVGTIVLWSINLKYWFLCVLF